jgi:hypothetical protein
MLTSMIDLVDLEKFIDLGCGFLESKLEELLLFSLRR